MAQDNNEKLVWFALGTVLGASLAVLFAPTSGAELRQDLGVRTGDGQRALAQRGRELLDRGRELYDRGRQIADDAAAMFDEGRHLAQADDELNTRPAAARRAGSPTSSYAQPTV